MLTGKSCQARHSTAFSCLLHIRNTTSETLRSPSTKCRPLRSRSRAADRAGGDVEKRSNPKRQRGAEKRDIKKTSRNKQWSSGTCARFSPLGDLATRSSAILRERVRVSCQYWLVLARGCLISASNNALYSEKMDQ